MKARRRRRLEPSEPEESAGGSVSHDGRALWGAGPGWMYSSSIAKPFTVEEEVGRRVVVEDEGAITGDAIPMMLAMLAIT